MRPKTEKNPRGSGRNPLSKRDIRYIRHCYEQRTGYQRASNCANTLNIARRTVYKYAKQNNEDNIQLNNTKQEEQ